MGNDTLELNEVLELDNTFNINLRGEEVVGLRIKGITSENKERIQVIKDKYLGKKYNYLFIINLAQPFLLYRFNYKSIRGCWNKN